MKVSFFSLLYLIAFTVVGQTISLHEVCSLPTDLAETSGLEVTGANQFWTHNDSGGQPAIYAFDSLGNISRTVELTNAANNDWEDITQDNNGNLFLGDFGNNINDRKNLCIYKIPALPSITGNSVAAASIQFNYPDQNTFPPTASQKNFDVEAMIFFNDSLYLFSKNQTVPFSGYTRLYRLPVTPGSYTAALVDSFYTGTDAIAGQITAAAISPDKQRLALLSYTKLYVFREFTGSNFFSGKLTQLDINSLSQKEGLVFANNCTVYITDEEFLATGRKLYQANICPVTTGLNTLHLNPSLAIRTLYPNPAFSQVAVQYELPTLSQNAQLLVYTLEGHEVNRSSLSASSKSIELPVNRWPAGIYYCRIETSTSYGYMYKLAVIK